MTSLKIDPKKDQNKSALLSGIIGLLAVALAYAPLPGVNQKIVVVSGTELTEPLQQIKEKFEQENPNITLELEFQGSQDMINKYVDQKNEFTPTVLIPASSDKLEELKKRLAAETPDPFYETPQPIAKTFLVGVAWPERGQVIFPDGQFRWQNLEAAIRQRNWQQIGGQSDWGSFDFLMSDPTRSNSGQMTLSLWSQAKLNNSNPNFSDPPLEALFSEIKRSVYLPPRSTDILLQEFITRGPNDADIVTVYESIALYRWQQSGLNKGKPYQIYYLTPTIEVVAAAAIMRPQVSQGQAKAAQEFISFIRQPAQQEVLIQYGFRPVVNDLDLASVPNSPWGQNIPGSQINPPSQLESPPSPQTIGEILRLWERVR
ncbi:MAG: substrate-binding domain-containing protein [Microcystaceae cyanobacterium]